MLRFATIALAATVALAAVPANPANWKAAQTSVTVSHVALCTTVCVISS